MKQVLASSLLLFLTACAGQPSVRSIAGACDVFPAPEKQIRGVTRDDRLWIAETIEAGVYACHWKRPKASIPVKARRVSSISNSYPYTVRDGYRVYAMPQE